MRASGYEPEDFDVTVEVWEDNRASIEFFVRLSTQWRHGANGYPTGLDYTAVLAMLRTLRLPRAEADALFADVQAMERAALNEMRKT